MLYIVWEFRLKKGHRKAFETHYSANGTWAKLFRKSADYIETRLMRDQKNNERYLLIDVWKDSTSFRKFKTRYRKDYEALDQMCEQYTEQENLIGNFITPGAIRRL